MPHLPTIPSWLNDFDERITIVEHPDAGHVGLRIDSGDVHVNTVPLRASLPEAIDYCKSVFRRGPRVPVTQ